MINLTVLYGMPDDPEGFADHYRTEHIKLARNVPNMVTEMIWGPVTGTLGGEPSRYFWSNNFAFADKASMDAALASHAGQIAAADMAPYATGGVTILVTEVEPEDGAR